VLGLASERLAQPPDVPPVDREALELLARADGELERGRDVVEMTAAGSPRERRFLLRVDDDVSTAGASVRRPDE
jgi:hypothetical protein